MLSDDEFDSDEYNELEDTQSGSDDDSTSSEEEEDDENESSSEDDSLLDSSGWKQVGNLPSPPPPFTFIATDGIDYAYDDDAGELEFFESFMDNEIIDVIVVETNRLAQQLLTGAPERKKKEWYPTTRHEIKVFLAIVMLQSIVHKPTYQLYWSKHPLLHTPIFGKLMSFRRFSNIKKYLHFSNNEEYDEATHSCPKLNKIWPMYKKIVDKCKNMYTPEKDVTIDESLMLYKGRVGWVQYIPLKRARFGIKYFMLCESKSGYVWDFIIYTGKTTVYDDAYKHLPVSSKVVMTLMKPLLNKGYCLTIDNFYSSPDLAEMLVANETDVYGTIRLTRKHMPDDISKEKLKKGEIISYSRGKLTAMRWKDKKDVSLLSTIHNAAMVEVEKRDVLEMKPKAVMDYNNTMGGVDRVDQHLADYPTPRKRGKRYYKKIFFHILDLTVWNAYCLYKKSGGNKKPLQFRIQLIDKLLQENQPRLTSPKAGRPGRTPPLARLTERHFPDIIPATEKKKSPTRVCVVCSQKRDANGKKIQRESRYFCPDCNVGLCVAPCFKIYHTSQDF